MGAVLGVPGHDIKNHLAQLGLASFRASRMEQYGNREVNRGTWNGYIAESIRAYKSWTMSETLDSCSRLFFRILEVSVVPIWYPLSM